MEKTKIAGNAKQAANSASPMQDEVEEQDSVDKIRDILFGNQMRELDRKFAKLEERIASDLASIRQESTSQIDSLQSFVESEIEILSSKLGTEEKTRVAELDEVDAEIKKSVRQINDKIAELVKSLDKQSRDTNQKILKQSQDFSADLNSQMEQTRKRMDGYNQELTFAKVDKTGLADILSQVALQLNQEDLDPK